MKTFLSSSLIHCGVVISLCGATAWAQTVEQIKPSTSASGVSAIGGAGQSVAPIGGVTNTEKSVSAISSSDNGKTVGAIDGNTAKAATAVDGAVSQAAALDLVLKALRARQMTPQAAWDSGALDVDGVLFLLEKRIDQWGGFFYEKDEILRRDITKLLVEHGGARIEKIEKLSPWVRLWLADYYGSVGNTKVLALSESVIGELKAGAVGQKDLAFQAVERIGWFYRDAGQHEQSAQAWLRLPPLLKATSWQIPDSLMEAGRAYRLGGKYAQADLMNAEVLKYDDGWLIGLVLYEESQRLMAQKQHLASRALLLSSLLKSSAVSNYRRDAGRVLMLSALSFNFYSAQEFKQATEYAAQAIRLYESLQTPENDGGLQHVVGKAYEVRNWVSQWQHQSIVCWPKTVDLSVLTHHTLKRTVNVRTFPARELKIVSSSPDIKLRWADDWKESDFGFYFDRTLTIETIPKTLKPDFKAIVTVSDAIDSTRRDTIEFRF